MAIKREKSRHLLLMVVVTWFALSCPLFGRTIVYDYRPIATSAAPYVGFVQLPGMNNNGEVAFIAAMDNGDVQINVSDGITTTVVASESTHGGFRNTPLSVNDAGRVTFIAGDIIYAGDGRTTTVIADRSGFLHNFHGTSINNFGQVAFVGITDTSKMGVFVGDGSDIRTLVTEDRFTDPPSFEFNGFGSDPQINDNGQVAIKVGSSASSVPSDFVRCFRCIRQPHSGRFRCPSSG